MDRVIKFRAWSKTQNKMDYEPWFDEYSGGGAPVNAFDHHKDLEFMQFTGLLDKNGKEIYEGDILKNRPNGNKYNGGIGIVEYVTNNPVGHPINGYWAALYDEAWTIYPKECEIVGNIYENPNLLK